MVVKLAGGDCFIESFPDSSFVLFCSSQRDSPEYTLFFGVEEKIPKGG
jgi:hypothetical protein